MASPVHPTSGWCSPSAVIHALVPFRGPDATPVDLLIFKSVYGVVLSIAVVPSIAFGAFDNAGAFDDELPAHRPC